MYIVAVIIALPKKTACTIVLIINSGVRDINSWVIKKGHTIIVVLVVSKYVCAGTFLKIKMKLQTPGTPLHPQKKYADLFEGSTEMIAEMAKYISKQLKKVQKAAPKTGSGSGGKCPPNKYALFMKKLAAHKSSPVENFSNKTTNKSYVTYQEQGL